MLPTTPTGHRRTVPTSKPAPGRIDLGLGRAPGTDHVTARACDARRLAGHVVPPRRSGAHFLPRAQESLRTQPDAGSGYLPEIWLLDPRRLVHSWPSTGLPFSFAYHFAPALLDQPSHVPCPFESSRFLDAPYLMWRLGSLCADNDEAAGSRFGCAQHFAACSGPTRTASLTEEAAANVMSDAEVALVSETQSSTWSAHPSTSPTLAPARGAHGS